MGLCCARPDQAIIEDAPTSNEARPGPGLLRKQTIKVNYDDDENITPVEMEAAKMAPKLKKYNTVKGDKVDECVKDIMDESDVLIPIIRISEGFYLIGTEKKQVSIKGDSIMVRIGGGYEKIDQYISKRELDQLMKIKLMVEMRKISFKECIKQLLAKHTNDDKVFKNWEKSLE